MIQCFVFKYICYWFLIGILYHIKSFFLFLFIERLCQEWILSNAFLAFIHIIIWLFCEPVNLFVLFSFFINFQNTNTKYSQYFLKEISELFFKYHVQMIFNIFDVFDSDAVISLFAAQIGLSWATGLFSVSFWQDSSSLW